EKGWNWAVPLRDAGGQEMARVGEEITNVGRELLADHNMIEIGLNGGRITATLKKQQEEQEKESSALELASLELLPSQQPTTTEIVAEAMDSAENAPEAKKLTDAEKLVLLAS